MIYNINHKIIYNSFEYEGTDEFTPIEMHKLIKDKTIQIKITEVNNMLLPLGKISKVGDDELINLLQYFSLLEELVKSNG